MIPMDNVQEGLTNIINIAQSLDPTTIIYLLGSHAQDSATERSDIDLLIIHANKKSLTKILKTEMRINSSLHSHHFDIKIINHKEVNHLRNKEYFLVYSMIRYGKCLKGKKIAMKFLPERINQEYFKIMDQIDRLENMIDENIIKDYQTIAALIFVVGKSLRFMERIVNTDYRSLKEIFGNNLKFLGKEYETVTRKQGIIKTALNQEIIVKSRKNTKYNNSRIKRAIVQVRNYGYYIGSLFDKLEQK